VAFISEIDSENSVKVRKAFFGEQVESEGYARRLTDPLGALAELTEVPVRIFVRRRIENLTRKPENPLCFVNCHKLRDNLFEVRKNFDLRKHLGVGCLHAHLSFPGFMV